MMVNSMEVISQKNLDKLIEMGFEIKYKNDGIIRLFNGKYNFGVDLYHSHPRDEYQGIYMSITDIDGKEVKHCKGRNVISNVKRWIELVLE